MADQVHVPYMLIYIVISTVIFLLIPDVCHAWGPGTHIEIAFSMVEKMALLAPAVRAVVAGREEWFVYGSVAADIVVGKKFAGHDNCHNWHVAREVLKRARTDRERAAAYGYISHLAADIVAHNYYIPYKIIENYRARLLSHTYWEMRFDIHVRQHVWEKMMRMISGDFSPFDDLLEDVLKHVLFSFRTSKTIFSSILAFQRFKQFRRTFSVYAKRSRFKLDTGEISHYMRLAEAASLDVLSHPESARCLQGDPTGSYKLEYAGWLRRHIKRAVNNGTIHSKDAERLIPIVKQGLYKGIYEPQVILPSLNDLRLRSSRT